VAINFAGTVLSVNDPIDRKADLEAQLENSDGAVTVSVIESLMNADRAGWRVEGFATCASVIVSRSAPRSRV
jgi:hypothetical protein